MPTDVTLPDWGTEEDARVLRWLKLEGDTVAQGEPLAA